MSDKLDSKIEISVVVPLYKGECFINELYERLCQNLSGLSPEYEIILVNDCSPNGDWTIVCDLCDKDPRVKGVNLSRNFGQHYAITAGLNFARGEWVVVMDCDLQDRPEEIPGLYKMAVSGFDSVFAQRVIRKDPVCKRLQSWFFYKVFSFLTDTKIDASVANFGIYNKKVICAILQMGDKVRFFPTMSQWVGFHRTYFPVEHVERPKGQSSYSLLKLLHLAVDNMIAFSDKPLKLCVWLGFVMAFCATVTAILYLIQYFLGRITVPGYGSLILSLWFIGGVLMAAIGMVGVYIGKIFDQVKQRPVFLVSDKKNL